MFKIIIVDDKPDVSEGIIKMINWSEIGIEVAGKGCDGQEAMELVYNVQPDIVITDIKMPIMDGIQLTRLIKEQYPGVKIIILSGYDDFSYAQQAVKLGAEEYLLKPARFTEIRDAILRAKCKLQIERKKKEEDSIIQQKLLESLPLLKEEYFNYLIGSPASTEDSEVQQRFDFLGIKLDCGNFAVLLIEPDNMINMSCGSKYGIKELEKLRVGISCTADRIISQYFKSETFRYGQNKVVVLVNYIPGHQEGDNRTAVYELAERIKGEVEKSLGVTVTIGIGESYKCIDGIYYSFREAQEALTHKLYLGPNHVIPISDVKMKNHIPFNYPNHLESQLILAAKIGASEQVLHLVDKYFDSILGHKDISPMLLKKILREFIAVISRLAMEVCANEQENVDYFNEFDKFNTLDEIKSWLTNILHDIAENVQKRRKTQLETDIEKAKAYILNNYFEDISLQSLSDYVCLSPTYFSAVFKEYVGETFIEFLTRTRIEKAKEILLAGSSKIYEVALKVGYTDQRYFSKVFKKYTGVNPGDYVQ